MLVTRSGATETAPLRHRVGAALLDWLVYGVALVLVLLLLPLATDVRLLGLGPLSGHALGAAALAAVELYQIFLLAKTGQSLGKRWLRIEIVRTSGRPPGFLFAVLLRGLVPASIPIVAFLLLSDRLAAALGEIVSPASGGLVVVGLLGVLDVALIFGPNRRCLHDYIAGTKVVVGYAVPVQIRHVPLAALALLLAPVAVGLSSTASFALLYAKSCSGARKDCDGRWSTLCEADLTSTEHCGACGNECGRVHAAAASCVKTRCVITCEQGFADCDGDASNDCEVALSSDPARCGGCAVDCHGASCKGGICGPLRIGRGAMIVVDETAVYAYGEDLAKVPLDGSPPVRLAAPTGHETSTALSLVGMAVDEDRVYWAPRGGRRILAVPIQGGPAVVVAETASQTPRIAFAGESLVWVDGISEDLLMEVSTFGGKPTVAVSGRYPTSATRMFGASSSGIAWANGQGIWFLRTGTLRPRKVVDHEVPLGGIVMDSTHVYWAESTALMSVLQEGGTPTRLATMRTSVPLLLDADDVYWADVVEEGARNIMTVMRVSKRGGEPVVVVSHPFFFKGFAINSTHLFWADERDEIFMYPKSPR